jgi:hypothetical protein
MSHRTLDVAVVDLVARKPTRSPYARLMNANFVSIMPQVVATWAQRAGHRVHYVVYTGFEDLLRELPEKVDVVFMSAYTPAAYLAYALSHLLRERGAITVLGGPHARAYAEDARQHFDYVLGFTDRALVDDLLADPQRASGPGQRLSTGRQPDDLPGVRERWPFVRRALDKTWLFSAVPMLGSVGCPYTCSFCIDAKVDYRMLALDRIREDLVFLQKELPRPVVGWHDPNFAIRFDDYLGVIDEVVPPGAIHFVAECSLSVLNEPRLKALQRQRFEALTLGIESWHDFGGKARGRSRVGMEKVESVAEQVNTICRYVPYVQTNYVWGLDQDAEQGSFDLTRRFFELAPAAFPAHNLYTIYGDSAPLGVELTRAGRQLNVPYLFQDTSRLANVRLALPADEFYAGMAGIVRDSYSPRAIARRLRGNEHRFTQPTPWMNLVRSLSSAWRIPYYRKLERWARSDREFQRFARGEATLPRLGRAVRQELGPVLYERLPRPLRAELESAAA